jgi:hypothetical protein
MDCRPDDILSLLDFLAQCGTQLKSLDFSATGISDPGLVAISMHAPNLCRLILADNNGSFSNTGVHHCLAGLAHLCELDVSGNAHVSGRCALLDIAAPIGGTEDAIMSGHDLHDDDGGGGGVSSVDGLDQEAAPVFNNGPSPFSLTLNTLRLRGLHQMTSRSVQIFAVSCGKTLQSIDLTGCAGVSDEACRSIAEFCPTLRDLRLRGCTQITSLGVGLLCSDTLPVLERLDMTGLFRVRDVFLSSTLARSGLIIRLSRLELSQTSIADKGIKQIALRLASGTTTTQDSIMSYEFAFESKFEQVRLNKVRSLAEQRERMYLKAARQAYDAGDWVLARATRQQAAEDTARTIKEGEENLANTKKVVNHIDLRGCTAVTFSSLSILLTMGDHLIRLVSLDIRGCAASLQRAAHKAASLCASTLTTLKLGFPLSTVAPPSKSTKAWNIPEPPQGPTDKVLRAILRDCRKLETLVVHACQQLTGSDDVFRYASEEERRLRYRNYIQRKRGLELHQYENADSMALDTHRFDTASEYSYGSSFVDEVWDEDSKSWLPEQSTSFFDPDGSIHSQPSSINGHQALPPFTWCPPPHPCLTELDISGCNAIDADGLSRILRRVPHVRTVTAPHTPAASALAALGASRLHCAPLVMPTPAATRRAGGAATKQRSAQVVGFSPDQGYEKRCRWWAQHDVHWRASRRIAKGWHEWWAYTLRKRGATGFQRCFRGFRVRIRFKRKRDRALLRQAKQSATALMQRMGRGFCGRKAAAVRRKQMGTVQLLFSKQLFSRKERSIYTWKRNAKIKKSAKILRMRIFDRERLSRLRRFWDLWGEGIVKQVKACMTIQNSLLRVRVAVRERNRKRAQRRWDIRFGALVRLQSWWRGNSTRFRLLVQRFRRMPGALMVRARLLFRGGIGWKALGLIPNKSGGLGHTVCADEIGAATSAERKHDILEIRVPELPDPVQLLRDPRKINQVDKQRIIDALEFEDRGMGCWYEATESWKEATGALLRKGELTNDFELHVLERLMALERSRGEVFKCAELHKRAKRVCTNMLRAVQDYGHRADEIRDRLYLYRRRRQLLVELLRYRMAFPTLANPDRMACEDDRERRIEWWSVRQAMRQLGRVYESKRARQSELEASKHKAWKELSKDSVAAHAEWLQKDQAYRQAHAKLVGGGALGIGQYMLSTVVHGDGGGKSSIGLPVASAASSAGSLGLGSNRHYLHTQAARAAREEARQRNDALACALEQKTIELEVARGQLAGVLEGIRRCDARSIFALTRRRDGHALLDALLKK